MAEKAPSQNFSKTARPGIGRKVILSYKGIKPTIGPDSYIAPTAAVIGDVILGEGCSVWFSAVLRGDVHHIRIGKNTNIQDNSTVHVTYKTGPTHIGDNVTIAHNVCVHGCTIEDDCLIGMGATVLDGAVIGKGSLVGAGALVTPNTIIPPNSLVLGAPAKVVRPVSEKERAYITNNAPHYRELGLEYM